MRGARLGAALASLVLLPQLTAAQSADQDSDGIPDSADAYPTDSRYSGATFFPAEDVFSQLMFEDKWPALGDADFNDVVLAYNIVAKTSTAGLRHLTITLAPLANGGNYDNAVGLHLPIPRGAVLSVSLTTASSSTALDWSAADPELTFELIPNLRDAFPGASGPVNVFSGSYVPGTPLQIDVELNTPVSLSVLDAAPFDVFLRRLAITPGHEIHRQEYPGTAAMDSALFGSTPTEGSVLPGGPYFIDTRGLPFALDIPTIGVWPSEGTDIASLFPRILEFASSAGTSALDYYSVGVVNTAAFAPPSGASTTPELLPGYNPGFSGGGPPPLTQVPHLLAVGATHTCAIRSNGRVACWGANDRGQLGNGNTASSSTPLDVPGVVNAVAVVSDGLRTCALSGNGSVQCWGRTFAGSSTPFNRFPGLRATSISMGGAQELAATFDDGSAAFTDLAQPSVLGVIPWEELPGFAEEIACDFRTCAIRNSTGLVRTVFGESLDALTGATAIAATTRLEGSTSRFCGRLGTAIVCAIPDQPPPLFYVVTSAALAMSSHASHYPCIVNTDGTVLCEQMTESTPLFDASFPIAGVSNAIAIDGQDRHACALTSSRAVYCWDIADLGPSSTAPTLSAQL